MKIQIIGIIFLLKLFFYIKNADISINRSIKDEEQSKYSPFVVTLSSNDVSEPVRGVDLICIIDYSGSMKLNNKLQLVKDSLILLIENMNDNDNLALVKFDIGAEIYLDFTSMTSENKLQVIEKINKLPGDKRATNITAGIEKGLELLKKDYSDDKNVASMILLSDGEDSYISDANILLGKIQNLLAVKKDTIFTLHSFGFGDDHDYHVLYEISKFRDGGYYFIRELIGIQKFLPKIYGLLSTTYKTNVELTIKSEYPIKKIYGIEDLYKSSPSKSTDLKKEF